MFYPFCLPPLFSLSVFQPNSWWFPKSFSFSLCYLKAAELLLPLIPDLFILPVIVGFCGARLRQVNSLEFKWVRCLSLLSAECLAIYGTCCQWTSYVVALMRLIAHLLLCVLILNWQQQPFKVNNVLWLLYLFWYIQCFQFKVLLVMTVVWVIAKIIAHTSIIIDYDSLYFPTTVVACYFTSDYYHTAF